MTKTPYSLITHLFAQPELPVLEDWLVFFDWPPEELIIHTGQDATLQNQVKDLAAQHGLPVRLFEVESVAEIKANEAIYLREGFGAVRTPLACIVKMDTLPHRKGGLEWQEHALDVMSRQKAVYLTGSVKTYRSDRPIKGTHALRASNLSINFAFMKPKDWLEITDFMGDRLAARGRFINEGNIEVYCNENGLYGVRMPNTADWHILHTQQWGPKMLSLREDFHAGYKVAPYIEGYRDDVRTDYEHYYMHVRANPVKRWLALFDHKAGKVWRSFKSLFGVPPV